MGLSCKFSLKPIHWSYGYTTIVTIYDNFADKNAQF